MKSFCRIRNVLYNRSRTFRYIGNAMKITERESIEKFKTQVVTHATTRAFARPITTTTAVWTTKPPHHQLGNASQTLLRSKIGPLPQVLSCSSNLTTTKPAGKHSRLCPPPSPRIAFAFRSSRKRRGRLALFISRNREVH